MLSPFRNAPGQREDQQQPAGRQVSRPPGKQAKGAKASDSRADVTPAPHSVEMFAHLPPYRVRPASTCSAAKFVGTGLPLTANDSAAP